MKPECSLTHSQEPATCPYPEPDQSSPSPHSTSTNFHFNIIPQSTPDPSTWSPCWLAHNLRKYSLCPSASTTSYAVAQLFMLFNDGLTCWDWQVLVIHEWVRSIGGMIFTGIWSRENKTYPSGTLSTINPTQNLGLRGKIPVTTRRSHGTPSHSYAEGVRERSLRLWKKEFFRQDKWTEPPPPPKLQQQTSTGVLRASRWNRDTKLNANQPHFLTWSVSIECATSIN
jgi:hypothetical protein